MKPVQVTPVVAHHAEGPVWWPRLNVLRFVDMMAGAVCTLERNGRVTRVQTGSAVAACIRPRAEGGAIMATERGIAVADRDDLRDTRPWGGLIADARQRCNDGACDPDGRFYIGSMGYGGQPEIAALYRVDPGSASASPVVWGLTTSNGLAWSPDGATAYLNDTGTGTTYAFDYSTHHGLANQRVLLRTPPADGRPDGLCVDAEGGLWIAMNSAGRIDRYAPDGTRTASVEFPFPGVTACTFGGPGLGTLYVTTSRAEPAGAAGPDPRAGSIWAVNPAVRGLPALCFRGEVPRHYT